MTAGILCVGSSGFPNLAPQGLEVPFFFPREIHFLALWGLLEAFLVELAQQILREVQNRGESLWIHCPPAIDCCVEELCFSYLEG